MFGRKKKTAAREHTPGEVRYAPKWAQRKAGKLKPAKTELPTPLTRQLRRQLARRAEKQPLGMTQIRWHDLKGFGKVQPFGTRRARRAGA